LKEKKTSRLNFSHQMESIDTNVDHFYGRNIREQLVSLYTRIQQAFLSSLIKIGLKNMK
jgi:hypothetical protein